jgi:hypothetical protein
VEKKKLVEFAGVFIRIRSQNALYGFRQECLVGALSDDAAVKTCLLTKLLQILLSTVHKTMDEIKSFNDCCDPLLYLRNM